MIERFYFACEFLFIAAKVWATMRIIAAISKPRIERKTEIVLQGLLIGAISAFHVYNSYLTEDLFSNIAFVFLITVISLALNKMYQCQKGSAFIVTYYVWIGLALMDFFVQTLAYMSLRDLQISGVSILTVGIYRGLYLLLCAGLLVFFAICFCKYLKKRQFAFYNGLRGMYYLAIPLVICAFYFQQIYILTHSDRVMNHWWIFILGMVVVFLISKIYGIRREDEYKYLLQQQRLHLLEDNYCSLKQAYEEKSILLHDLNKYVCAIDEIALAGEEGYAKNRLLDVVRNMKESWSRKRQRNFSNHGLLDLILNQKYEEANNVQIKVYYEFDDMSDLQMTDTDICALFVNLLDNAIEANQRQGPGEKRWIQFSCYRKEWQLIIVTANPAIETRRQVFTTTKQERELHGFGMLSIRRVIDSYSGYMEAAVEENVFQLSAYLTGFETV